MTLLVGFDPRRNAQEILDVMPNFMRDNVGLGEISRRMKSVAKILKETHIEINFLIFGAIERTHRRLGKSAGRVHSTREQHELGFPICLSRSAKYVRPGV